MEDQSIPAAEALALAMMNSFGQLSLIMMHMHRHRAEGNSASDAPEPPFALTEILKSVLPGLAEDHDIEDMATAVQMLQSATELIGEELFVFDFDRFDIDTQR